MKSDLERVDDLIEQNMGLVVQLAKSFYPSNADLLDEYIQLGRIGLWRAILKHDPLRGKLSTIGWHYIRWEIIKYINQNNRHKFVPLAEVSQEDSIKLWEIIPDNVSELERDVIYLKYQGYTFKEIGYQLGFTKGRVYKMFNNIKKKINV